MTKSLVKSIGVFVLLLACIFTHFSCKVLNSEIDNAWQAYDGFNDNLLDKNKYIYKTNTSYKVAKDRWNGAAAIWCQPIFWDMAMNAYKLALRTNDRKRTEEMLELNMQIFEGNKKQYVGFDFHNCNENTGWFIYDDIQWWTITLARAYQLFGNEDFLRLSEKSFRRVWYGSDKVGDTGSYDPEKGGMFWQWQPIQNPKPNNSERDGKMACINFPTVIAAMTLYNCLSDNRQTLDKDDSPFCQTKDDYFKNAKDIYNWGVDNLFDKNTGRVADSKHGSSNPDWKAHVYNQGTFIGASVLLYKATNEQPYLDNAILAADYTIKEMSKEKGILPFETGIEQGIYTAIFAQYMHMLVYEGGQSQYIPFLKHTMHEGWKNRDKSRDLCGGEYEKKVNINDTIDCYSASGIPAMMLLFCE